MDTYTCPGEVVLVHIDGKPSFYARVEAIEPDVKSGWRRFHFSVLSVPTHRMMWILEPAQIDGMGFTMGGTDMRIERMEPPGIEDELFEESGSPKDDEKPRKPKPTGKIISFPGGHKKGGYDK